MAFPFRARQQNEPYNPEQLQLYRMKFGTRCSETDRARRKIVMVRENGERVWYLECPFGHREKFVYDEQRDI